MKLRFIKERDNENEYDNTAIQFKTIAECLPEVLEDFESFLRACGYIFDGSLQVVSDISEEDSDEFVDNIADK